MGDSVIGGIKLHAIRTDDQSVWIDFNGDVPRVGETINIELMGKYHEISEDLLKKEWVVYKVEWFLANWRVEAFPSTNLATMIMSQARVFIKEVLSDTEEPIAVPRVRKYRVTYRVAGGKDGIHDKLVGSRQEFFKQVGVNERLFEYLHLEEQ